MKVRLFIKPWCPWCQEAEAWLRERGIQYERLDVTSDQPALQEMIALTHQRRAPSIEVEGQILADFDTDQLAQFWKKFE